MWSWQCVPTAIDTSTVFCLEYWISIKHPQRPLELSCLWLISGWVRGLTWFRIFSVSIVTSSWTQRSLSISKLVGFTDNSPAGHLWLPGNLVIPESNFSLSVRSMPFSKRQAEESCFLDNLHTLLTSCAALLSSCLRLSGGSESRHTICPVSFILNAEWGTALVSLWNAAASNQSQWIKLKSTVDGEVNT